MSQHDGILGKLNNAREVLGDLGQIIMANPGTAMSRARFVAGKVPSMVEGLKLIGKKDKAETLSIGTFLERNAREWPDAPALFFEDMRFTHRQLNDNANRYANLYAKRGVGKGDPVAIFVDNRPELLFAVAGAIKLGAIAALINTKQRKHVLTHSFRLCEARAFVVGEELWPAFAEVRDTLPGADPEHVFFIPDEGDMEPPRDATDVAAELGSVSAHTPAALSEVSLGDPCFYVYTSGTTGLPKASIMSHLRWVKAAGAFGKLALDLDRDDVIYTPLPLYHNNALTVTWSSAA
ncbi:MAG TPA: AMP-binding protein, partial [Kofleriaceae bacterium]|nr:AMP-binding protein [Kofleriaceae bacterium]